MKKSLTRKVALTAKKSLGTINYTEVSCEARLREELANMGSEQMCAYEPYHLNKNKKEKK